MLSQWQQREGGFTVKLDDPQTEGKMMMKHTTYRVSTSREGEAPTATCRHRFSDFLKLHAAIGTGDFPVEKALLQTAALKASRVDKLES